MRQYLYMFAFLLCLIQEAIAHPTIFAYQGYLTDQSDHPISGAKQVTFRIYRQSSNGDVLWVETQQVNVDQGVFYANVGINQPLPTDFSYHQDLYLGIQIDQDAEMNPRVLIAPALKAKWAEQSVHSEVAEHALDVANEHIHPQTVSVNNRMVIDANGRWVGEAISGTQGPQGPQGPQGRDGAGANLVCNEGEIIKKVNQVWTCVSHATDPAGIAIHPSAVTVGNSNLTSGRIDLGNEANDELTAAMIKTLTNGGNADALHTHTAQQATNTAGGCYVAWGLNTCGEGYRVMYEGKMVSNLDTFHPFCIANVTISSGGRPQYIGLGVVSVSPIATYNSISEFQNGACVQCCP